MDYNKMLITPNKSFSKDELISGIKRKKRAKAIQRKVFSMFVICVIFFTGMITFGQMHSSTSFVVDGINLDSLGFNQENYYTTAMENEDVFWESFRGFEDISINDINKEI